MSRTDEQTELHLGDRELTLDGVVKSAVDAALAGDCVINVGESEELREAVAALVQQGVAVPASATV
jgi:hypothetical protein